MSSKSINYNRILQVNDQLNDELAMLGNKFDYLNNMDSANDSRIMGPSIGAIELPGPSMGAITIGDN